ncbi:MAG: protein translocase subunit SecDF [Bacteroidetes bacterium]|nr:protein translocase subunit SecDF [Bacteroidota bacterium]
MQSKGAIKFFAIAFAIVCLFQLSFTFFTSKVERNAKSYAFSEASDKLAKQMAKGDELRETYLLDSIHKARQTYYLDSMSNQVVYDILLREYTYQETKEREINLGLDLKGGMNVTMEINVGDIVNALSGYSQNPTFVEVLNRTYYKQRSSTKDFVSLFGETWDEVAPTESMAAVFNIVELKDKISYNSTNAEVLDVIREETEGAIDRSFNILRTRIDRFGVTQPNIQKLATSGRILVELPGIKDPARVRKLLQGTAKLEFWETYDLPEVINYLVESNRRLRTIMGTEEITNENRPEGEDIEALQNDQRETLTTEETVDTEGGALITETTITEEDTAAGSSLLDQIESDTSLSAQDRSFEDYAKENPLFAFLLVNIDQENRPIQSATVGYAAIKDTARINTMLKRTRTIFPRDLKLTWTVKPRQEGSNILELVALKATGRNNSAALGGDVIVDARQDYSQTGQVEVTMAMNGEGARVWKRITGENIGKQVAIVLDGYVYSYPNVNDEIPNGRSSITGIGSIEEAKDLANILKAGKLPAPARIVEEAVVGPSLGREAITSGLWSFVLAFSLVLLYMILYYNRAGWIADLALLTNIFFIFGILASLGAVLTLPGIAGIVLTLGMAVDANVIIYERIREEIRAGKGIRLAISDGYKNAYSAIIDGNVTTLLTGIVLYVFGTGPVQGFATTLIIGILSSLFSAIFISRLIFNWLLDKNKEINFDNSITRNILANAKFDFLKMRRGAYIFSSVIIIIGIASLFVRGLNFGIDFSGGRTYVVRFDQPVNTADIRTALTAEFDNVAPEVKTFGPTTQVKITTKYMIDDESPAIDSIIQTKLYSGLKPFFQKNDLAYKTFATDVETSDKLIGILSSQKVGPTIADDIRNKAILAVFFALVIIFVYIAIRFKRWQFGLAGVIALFHDSMITIGLFSLFYNVLPFSLEIDQAFIAAILTIIGYSINDTVIIFDRIREYNFLYPKKELSVNINNALNSTLGRTLNTAGTTIVVLLAIFIFGGEIIRGFTFALLIGIVIGTYSSLFNASPIAYDLLTRRKTKTLKKK